MSCLAVIDLETTGLNPYRHDRVIEVAAVVIKLDGQIVREFVSLINPERDIGPTSIHGLESRDILTAPRFADIAESLLETLAGCVVLAGHNIIFDHSFLQVEFGRLGHPFPNGPTLCTLQLAGGGSLPSCCSDYQIAFQGEAHTALYDARAAAQLLVALLRDIPQETGKILKLTPIVWPLLPKSSMRPLTRDESRKLQVEPPTYLHRLLTRMQGDFAPETDNSAVLAYTALLDRTLEDRRVDDQEAEALIELAALCGLDGERIREIHQDYLHRLAASALADGVVTDTERRDLFHLARLLGVEPGRLDDILQIAARKLSQVLTQRRRAPGPLGLEQLIGKRVCFTGECQCQVLGAPMTREKAEELATRQGMIVVDSVTKKLDLLVVADPLTQSGKAKRAERYGIRVMHEAVFWKAIGIDVE